MSYVDMGQKIKELRNTHRMTQEILATRLGVTKSMISAYENSTRYPSFDVLITLARVFHVSTDYLLDVSSQNTVNMEGLSEKNQILVINLISALRENDSQ